MHWTDPIELIEKVLIINLPIESSGKGKLIRNHVLSLTQVS